MLTNADFESRLLVKIMVIADFTNKCLSSLSMLSGADYVLYMLHCPDFAAFTMLTSLLNGNECCFTIHMLTIADSTI